MYPLRKTDTIEELQEQTNPSRSTGHHEQSDSEDQDNSNRGPKIIVEHPAYAGLEDSETVKGELKGAAELTLVNAARAGDGAAFEELFKRNSARIYRTARGLTQNQEEAEDIVQESFLKAFMNLNRFRGDSLLSTWLTSIAVNEALMKLRRQHKMVSIDNAEAFKPPLELKSRELSPEEQYSSGELSAAIAHAIRKLKPGLRAIFQLREIDRLSTEETAQILGLSNSAVKTRLLRARLKLRHSLSLNLGCRSTIRESSPAKETPIANRLGKARWHGLTG